MILAPQWDKIFLVSKSTRRRHQEKTRRMQSHPDLTWSHPIYFSEVYGRKSTEQELKELVTQFSRTPTFYLLANQNALVSFYQPGSSEKFEFVQRFLFDNLLDEHARSALANLPIRTRPGFHRQQLLLLMKFILVYAKESGRLDPKNDLHARSELGKACLMVNELLLTPDQEAALIKRDESPEEWERVHNELYAQMLVTAEISSVPDEFAALARSDEYLTIFENQPSKFRFSGGVDLTERVRRAKGMDLRRYLRLIFGVSTLYRDLAEDPMNFIDKPANFNIGRGSVFANMEVSDVELRSFFESTAIDLASLDAQIERPTADADIKFVNDLRVFRKYPLVYTRGEKDVAAIVDFQFLNDKLGNGLYHTVLWALAGEELDYTNFLMRYWGEVFEVYVNDRLRESAPTETKRFFYSPQFDFDKGFQAFDGALVLGSDLVLFEHKGKYLPVGAKYHGDKETLKQMLSEKFGKGVRQLSRSIEMVFDTDPSKRRTFSEYDKSGQPVNRFDASAIKKIRRVYPVIVVQDFSLQLGFANWDLREMLKRELSKRAVPENLVRPLTLITVEDLETVITHLREISPQNILGYHAKKLEPAYTFKYLLNLYLDIRKVHRRPNPWIDRRVHSIIDSMKSMFRAVG